MKHTITYDMDFLKSTQKYLLQERFFALSSSYGLIILVTILAKTFHFRNQSLIFDLKGYIIRLSIFSKQIKMLREPSEMSVEARKLYNWYRRGLHT